MGQSDKDKAIDAAVNAILSAEAAGEFVATMSAIRLAFIEQGWSAHNSEIMTIELFRQSSALMAKGES